MIDGTIRAQQLKELPQASAQFHDTMNAINNSNLRYEEKEAIGHAYIVLYPLWPLNSRLIIEALERINPRYEGFEKHIFSKSGLSFFANREYCEVVTAIAHLRQELWIDTQSGIQHVIEYSVLADDSNSISLDGEVLAKATGYSMRGLYEYGQRVLVAKVSASV